MTTILDDLNTKLGIADTSLDLLVSAVNDPAGTFRVADGTDVPNLRARLEAIGYLPPVAFGTGQSVTTPTFTVTYLDNLYAAKPSAVPFTTDGTFDPAEWVLLQRMDEFDTVSDLKTSLDSARGVGARWSAGGYRYRELDPAATNQDITTAGGVKLHTEAVGGAGISPAALGATPGAGASDQRATLQATIDACVREKCYMNLGGEVWRCEGTLHRNGLQGIIWFGAQIYFPPDATYERFRYDSGPDVGDEITELPQVIAFDMTGTEFVWLGNGDLIGKYLSRFSAADRATLNPNLVAIAGQTGPIAEMNACGQVAIQGFAYPFYVPENNISGMAVRQIPRTVGTWRTRFCLTVLGYFGAAANATDDLLINLRSDRCGGYGDIVSDVWRKSTVNLGYFFWYGLAELGASNNDREPGTCSVTSGSATVPLTDANTYVDAGDWIVIKDGYQRADGQLIPLVCQVASVNVANDEITLRQDTDGDTLEEHILPNRTASGLTWYYRPPQLNIAQMNITAQHFYAEGYIDSVRAGLETQVTVLNMKGGSAFLGGRQGCLFHALGKNTNWNMTFERELLQSTEITHVLAYGMLKSTSTQKEIGVGVNFTVPYYGDDDTPVGLVKGVKPPEYFTESGDIVLALDRDHYAVNVVTNHSDGVRRYYFAKDTGALTLRKSEDGLGVEGAQWYALSTKVGSQNKNVTIQGTTGSPVTVYEASATPNVAQLSPQSLYMLSARQDSNDLSQMVMVQTNSAGNISGITTMAGSDFVFAGVGTSALTCIRASGTDNLITSFSVINLITPA